MSSSFSQGICQGICQSLRVKVINSDHPKHVWLSLLWYNCLSVLYYLGSLLTICRTHVLLLYYLYRACFILVCDQTLHWQAGNKTQNEKKTQGRRANGSCKMQFTTRGDHGKTLHVLLCISFKFWHLSVLQLCMNQCSVHALLQLRVQYSNTESDACCIGRSVSLSKLPSELHSATEQRRL